MPVATGVPESAGDGAGLTPPPPESPAITVAARSAPLTVDLAGVTSYLEVLDAKATWPDRFHGK